MASIVPKSEWYPNHGTYCIPSHPVIKESSDTHKVRIVQNASCCCKSTGYSLNSLLLPGPPQTPEIVALVMQFRAHRHAIVTDISRMFWRVNVDDPDNNYLRYLWHFSGDAEPTMIQSKVLTFGLVSAPFQAIYTIRMHCDRFSDQYPLATKALRERLYVDDASALADDKEDAIETTRQIYDLLKKASMIPHKFHGSDVSILSDAGIPKDRWADKRVIAYLGLTWDTQTDEVVFDYSNILQDVKVHTKRTLASEMASVYDPIGFVSPVVCQAKCLFQATWLRQLEWDDPLPPDLLERWLKWRKDLAAMPSMTLPRLCCRLDDPKMLVLFSDASTAAYGAVAYVSDSKGGNLFFSKSKLVPNRISMKEASNVKMTIARLELLSIVLAVKAADYILKAMPIGFFNKVAFFTDSLVNLYRIRRGPRSYKVWVANRLRKILTNYTADQFHYVSGQQNPADCPSRSTTMRQLKENLIWWTGPAFIADHTEKSWPELKSLSRQEAMDAETRSMISESDELEELNEAVATVNALARPPHRTAGSVELSLYLWTHSWTKRCRLTAWLVKFIYSLVKTDKKEKLLGVLAAASAAVYFPGQVNLADQKAILKETMSRPTISPAESRAAEYYWVRVAQSVELPNAAGLPLPNDNGKMPKEFNELDPFLDEDGLVRAKTRLQPTPSTPYATCYPILLPKHSQLTDQLLLSIHERRGHPTKQATWHHIKKHFRVFGGKVEIFRVLRKCTEIYCNPPRALAQPWAPLPPERLHQTTQKTWSYIAVDFAGPCYTTHKCEFAACPHKMALGRFKTEKNWLAIFTDWTSRAVAIELVFDLSTQTFLEAFTRHCVRNGRPTLVYSDNQTTFKAADKELREFYKNIHAVADATAKEQITWRFSIPLAPHSNGAVETMVKAVKRALGQAYHHTGMPREQLRTQVALAEDIVNQRPLVCPSDDPDADPPITPNMLTKLRSSDPPPLDKLPDVSDAHHTRLVALWTERRKLQFSFWKKFTNQYLTGMKVRRGAPPGTWPEPKVGQVVLLREPNIMLRDWRLAVILEIKRHPVDGIIREVKLKTLKGVIVRHIKDISYLECDMPDVNPLADKKFQEEPRGGWTPRGPPEPPPKLAAKTPADEPKGPLTRSRRRALCRLSAAPNGSLVMHR